MNKTLSLRENAQRRISFKATSANLESIHYFCPDCSSENFDLNSLVLDFENAQDSNKIELLPMTRGELDTLATFFATGAKLGRATFLDHIPGVRFFISTSSHSSKFRKLQITIDNCVSDEVIVEANDLFKLAISIGFTGKVCIYTKENLVLAA